MIPFLLKQLLHGLLCVIFFFIATILVFLWCIRPFPVDASIPGPKRSRFLGVTFQEESKDTFGPGTTFEWAKWPTLSLELSKQFGFQTWGSPTLNIGFGGAFFNVVSPACLQHILKDNFDNYEKGTLTQSFQELTGQAIFTTDGQIWKFHRKIVTTILSWETVQHANLLWRAKLQQVETLLLQKASLQETFDFQDSCYKMVLDVFCRLAFGVELKQVDGMMQPQEQTSRKDNDDKSGPKATKEETQQQQKIDEFTKAFDKLQCHAHLRFNDLLWQFKQKHRIGEREQKIVQCKKIIDEFAYDVVRKALQRSKADAGDTGSTSAKNDQDIVTKFAQFCRSQNNQQDPSEQELRDFVMTFVLAGRDTTSVALSWTLWELTRHPTIMEAMREEVEFLIAVAKDDDCWTCGFGDQLSCTHAVVMESLRLHSPAPDNF